MQENGEPEYRNEGVQGDAARELHKCTNAQVGSERGGAPPASARTDERRAWLFARLAAYGPRGMPRVELAALKREFRAAFPDGVCHRNTRRNDLTWLQNGTHARWTPDGWLVPATTPQRAPEPIQVPSPTPVLPTDPLAWTAAVFNAVRDVAAGPDGAGFVAIYERALTYNENLSEHRARLVLHRNKGAWVTQLPVDHWRLMPAKATFEARMARRFAQLDEEASRA